MATKSTVNRSRLIAFRIACLKSGTTYREVAEKIGVSRSAISLVVAGRSRSAKIEAQLVKLFPEVFRKFPFDNHGKSVARKSNRRNCAKAQEGRSPTRRRSTPTRRRATKKAAAR